MSDFTAESSALIAEIRAMLGQKSTPEAGLDAVNKAMIRHWCAALSDWNPVYTDEPFATRSAHRGLIAPPAMLDAWTMRPEPPGAGAQILKKLNAAGYTSVVATNSEHEYDRYLRPGDQPVAQVFVADLSDEKQTALGRGRFFTNVTEITLPDGTAVGRVRMRILKFKPGTGRAPTPNAADAEAPRAKRPRPAISRDTKFFWEGIAAGDLRIQQCVGCEKLCHPPVVRCPDCGSYEQGYVVSSGRARLYSFVEPCHPKLPAFDSPYVVGLVELEEGTKLLTNIVDVLPDLVEIGMPLEVDCRAFDPELTLPVFRPATPQRRQETLSFEDVQVGDRLPLVPVPITVLLIVAGAIASRDFTAVHHDPAVARAQGSPDIFTNILTTNGLVSRYVTDWFGPGTMLKKLSVRLGAPNYPGDTMTFSGSVSCKEAGIDGGTVEVAVAGRNGLGNHVTGTVSFELPRAGGKR